MPRVDLVYDLDQQGKPSAFGVFSGSGRRVKLGPCHASRGESKEAWKLSHEACDKLQAIRRRYVAGGESEASIDAWIGKQLARRQQAASSGALSPAVLKELRRVLDMAQRLARQRGWI